MVMVLNAAHQSGYYLKIVASFMISTINIEMQVSAMFKMHGP